MRNVQQMSDESSSPDQPDIEEQDWPRRCEHCGHELVQTEVTVMPGGDEQMDVPIVQDVCPNPDCPSNAGSPGGTPGGE